MLQTILSALRSPDLRKKLLFTAAILAIYRFGSFVPVPGVDLEQLQAAIDERGSRLLDFLNLFAGGALTRFAVFALGIMPYITASIILQLMTVVIPSLERLQKEGESGQQKITQYTRYFTVVLAFLQSIAYVLYFRSQDALPNFSVGRLYLIVISVTAGTTLLMWLGELITQRGVGNGISLLIFASIVACVPDGLSQVSERVSSGDAASTLGVVFLVVVMVALIAVIVYVESARRNIAISYANRRVGNQTFRGQETSLPLKINMGGVIPVIFASSVLALPQTVFAAFPPDPNNPNALWTKVYTFFQQFHGGDPYYELVFLSLIVLFTFFYITIIFNTDEVADNLRKHGGFVAGIRPGAPTADYLNDIMTKLTTVGAIYLALVAFIPQLLLSGFKVARLPFFGSGLDNFLTSTPGLSWIPTGLGYQFYFGGTSLLILVGVAMDTVAQIEAQLVMRNYEGFLGAGSRLRGRRS